MAIEIKMPALSPTMEEDTLAKWLVKAGDTVAIVEAMKMKTPMIARVSGKVTNIAVKAGDPVEPGQVLLTIS